MRYLAVDLDRTLIPNGPSPDDGSLPLLKEILHHHNIAIIFVKKKIHKTSCLTFSYSWKFFKKFC